MKMILLTSCINLFIFFSGYFFLNFLNSRERNFKNLVAAYPIGAGVWSLLWIVSGIILGLLGFKGNLNTTIVAISILTLLNIIILIKNKTFRKDSAKFLWFLFAGAIVIIFSFLFFSLRQSIVFGDSYAFTTWSYSFKGLLSHGLPAIGLSLSNLSAYFMPDYYNYTFHQIISLCLGILIFDSIYFWVKSTENIKVLQNVLISLSVVSILVLTNNFLWHSIYANFHNLTAFWILFLCVLILDYSKPTKKEAILILLVLIFVTLVRMEGVILAMGIIVFFTHNKKFEPLIRRSITYKYMVFLFLYFLVLCSFLWQNELFSAKKYITLYISFLLFVYISERLYLKYTELPKFTGLITLTSVLIAYIFTVLINYEHMSVSTINFVSNSFNQGFWGITNYAILFLFITFIVIRIIEKKHYEYDNLIVFSVFSILVVLILSNFRPPYNQRWLDSGNRMLFHFLPIAIVWIGREMKRITIGKTIS